MLYRGRRAYSFENEILRVTVLEGGGHVAEIFHKPTGVNPLWTPEWPSIEPASYRAELHPEYGQNEESQLLSGIMGHNLCLDLFGAPGASEAAAGRTVHGEANVFSYAMEPVKDGVNMRVDLPDSQLRFSRELRLDGTVLHFRETVENTSICDRPIAWTQHATLGAPFLEPGVTEFRITATRGMTYPTDFSFGKSYLPQGAEFDWPHAPGIGGESVDLRRMANSDVVTGFFTLLMDPSKEQVGFEAHHPGYNLSFGYEWPRVDFPWLGVWEERHAREWPPWNGRGLARGMEFGASPFPEPRRAMIERGRLFETPTCRWLPALGAATVEYKAYCK